MMENVGKKEKRDSGNRVLLRYLPGSVAETMAPKKRQSVKKKSPPSWPMTFMNDTKPYMISLEGNRDTNQLRRWQCRAKMWVF